LFYCTLLSRAAVPAFLCAGHYSAIFLGFGSVSLCFSVSFGAYRMRFLLLPRLLPPLPSVLLYYLRAIYPPSHSLLSHRRTLLFYVLLTLFTSLSAMHSFLSTPSLFSGLLVLPACYCHRTGFLPRRRTPCALLLHFPSPPGWTFSSARGSARTPSLLPAFRCRRILRTGLRSLYGFTAWRCCGLRASVYRSCSCACYALFLTRDSACLVFAPFAAVVCVCACRTPRGTAAPTLHQCVPHFLCV